MRDHGALAALSVAGPRAAGGPVAESCKDSGLRVFLPGSGTIGLEICTSSGAWAGENTRRRDPRVSEVSVSRERAIVAVDTAGKFRLRVEFWTWGRRVSPVGRAHKSEFFLHRMRQGCF